MSKNEIAAVEKTQIKNNIDLLNDRQQLLKEFIKNVDMKKATAEAYQKGIKNFINFLESHDITNPTQETIKQYKNYLVEHNEAPTINLYLGAIRNFYKFLYTHYGIKDITTDIKTIYINREHKKDGLNIDQAKELINHSTNKRDRAIIILLLTAALRTIELERADIKDLTTKGNRYILKIQGKGHDKKDDYIIITDNTYKAINEYLATRENIKPSDPLFTSDSNNKKGERLTTRSIRRIVKDNLQQIGINTPKITTHSLRHTAITQLLLNNNKNIYEAQQLARHKSPATTQIYIDEIVSEEAKNKNADILENLYI